MPATNKKKNFYLNIAFIAVSITILYFLWSAPEETTSKLPHDAIHQKFHQIKSKKEAEKHCASCHDPGKEAPLPADHPPKFRCLFCHKR